jgi:PAS domain S-box-containing protein
MRFTPESLAESLESTAGPAFAVDAEGKIAAWNSAAETALGHSRTKALGELCFKVIRGKDVVGNRVCQRECLVFRSLRERTPVRRFRMHVHTATRHHVETECTVHWEYYVLSCQQFDPENVSVNVRSPEPAFVSSLSPEPPITRAFKHPQRVVQDMDPKR